LFDDFQKKADDVTSFAWDLERDPKSMDDLTMAPTSRETQNPEETQPKPQVAPASFNNNMTLENVEDFSYGR
jgi:hypothetical protein